MLLLGYVSLPDSILLVLHCSWALTSALARTWQLGRVCASKKASSWAMPPSNSTAASSTRKCRLCSSAKLFGWKCTHCIRGAYCIRGSKSATSIAMNLLWTDALASHPAYSLPDIYRLMARVEPSSKYHKKESRKFSLFVALSASVTCLLSHCSIPKLINLMSNSIKSWTYMFCLDIFTNSKI